ncbi:MAG: retroviral-like aspartic protease family protein [Fibromonadaceae bacterium]|jgi:predicted aspartyl protease|nr:retroviral-like aspartic protease family protein [Fibromonadaceae bacterium]
MDLNSGKKLRVRALWDTGATNTMVSKKVAAKLELKKTGEISVRSFAGEKSVNEYYLRLLLIGGFAEDLQVLELSEIKEADILIGMDVIGYGDFAFTLERERNISKAKIYFMSPSKGIKIPSVPH